MARAKRPWGVVAGPVVLGLGLAVFWGARSASAMRDQVIDWGYQLEHSAQPVSMQMPDVPMVPPLFINSDNMGRINLVVVQRNRPGAVDSVTILAEVPARFHRQLSDCALRLRVTSFDWHGYTHALRCTSETDGLLTFGHLNIAESDLQVPILVRAEDLPCDHSKADGATCGKTTERLRRELRQIQRDLAVEARQARAEVRVEAERIRQEARQIREEARRIRDEVRTEVRTEVRSAVRSNR